MANVFKINTLTANEVDFEHLFSTSMELDPQHNSLFDDKSVSTDELTKILDHNKDGQVKLEDLALIYEKLRSEKFLNFTSTLRRFGYDVYKAAAAPEIASDRDFLKALAIIDEKVIGDLPIEFLDEGFLLDVASGNSRVVAVLPSKYRNREFFSQLVGVNPVILKYAPDEFAFNDELRIVLAAVRKEGNSLSSASLRFRDSKRVVMQAAGQNGISYRYASGRLQEDIDVARLTLEQFPLQLSLFTTTIQDSNEAVLAAIKQNGMALEHASQRIKKDWRMVAEAIKRNPEAIRFADDSVLNELKSMRRLLAINPRIVRYLSLGSYAPEQIYEFSKITLNVLSFVKNEAQRRYLFERLLARFESEGIKLPNAMMCDYNTFFDELSRITEFPERFGSFAGIYEIWKNNREMEQDLDRRPVAVIFGTKDDWNGAFERYKLIDELVKSGVFRVFYFEIGDKTSIKNALKLASLDGKRPIHTLMIRGHGNNRLLSLVPEDAKGRYLDDSEIDEMFITKKDFLGGQLSDFQQYIDARGQLIIDSCHMAFGGSNGDNIASAAAGALFSSVLIYSNDGENSIRYIAVDPSTYAITIKYTGGHAYRFRGNIPVAGGAPKS